MSTETSEVHAQEQGMADWQAGVVGGLIAGLVFGGLMSMMTPPVLEMGIPAMYGIDGPAGAVGWVIHMAHAAVIGVAFAAIAESGLLGNLAENTSKSVGVGAAYGLLVWIGLAVIVMPIWLGAVGFGGAPPLPNIGVESFVGHLVYGVVLGAVYPALRRR